MSNYTKGQISLTFLILIEYSQYSDFLGCSNNIINTKRYVTTYVISYMATIY